MGYLQPIWGQSDVILNRDNSTEQVVGESFGVGGYGYFTSIALGGEWFEFFIAYTVLAIDYLDFEWKDDNGDDIPYNKGDVEESFATVKSRGTSIGLGLAF